MTHYHSFSNMEDDNVFMIEYSHSYPSPPTQHYGLPTPQHVIDPRLCSASDAPLPMYRYLQQDYLTAPMSIPQAPPANAVHHAQFTSRSARSQGRGGSPFSLHQSSGASSAQSPRTESDLPYDSTQGPSTPPGIKSPHLHNMSDRWDPQEALTGLTSTWSTNQYVNLAEIHPSLSLNDGHDGDGMKGISLDPGSSFNLQHSVQSRGAVSVASFRLSSPESEIHVQTLDPVYPDPEGMDDDVNHRQSIVVEFSANRDEEHAQFKPTILRHRSDSSLSQKHQSRPKRSEKPATLTRQSKVLKAASNPQSGSSRRLTTSGGYFPCPECNEVVYKDDASLQKHIKAYHKRPFICVFHFAGCTDAFANKNEWKRHVAAQHLNLAYWLCTHGSCGQTVNNDCEISGALTHGRPFRRKDLFTQHVRRMHMAAPSPEPSKHRKKASPEQDAQLKAMQESAFRKRCEMPSYMRCPAQGCSNEFHGEKAWDDRMEHIARHLERAANGTEPPVEFGGAHDNTLTNWAASPSVRVICRGSNGWEQCHPLKGTKIDLQKVPGGEGSMDEDAEGETCP